MNKKKNSKLSSKLQYMTESKILDKVHDVVITRNRYRQYAIRAMREATSEEPDVFRPDCDLIADVQKYHQCIECYRYEHCRDIWEKENRL